MIEGAARVIRLGDDFRWPGGRRIAVVFNIAFEAWSEGQAPGIGPMGNVLKPGFFDWNAHSWASFGAVRGIHRLLDVAERHGVRTSVMTNGVLGESAGDAVRAVHARGHEIVAHSWGMDVIPVYLDDAAERANLARTVTALTRASGHQPRGWISPRGTPSARTPKLLAEQGFLWHGDCNDDDRPYVLEFELGRAAPQRLVAIPLTMELNDLPLCVRYGQPPAAMLDGYEQMLRALRGESRGASFFDVTAHTHVFGRAVGAAVFGEIMQRARGAGDLWIATREQIACYVLERLGAAGQGAPLDSRHSGSTTSNVVPRPGSDS